MSYVEYFKIGELIKTKLPAPAIDFDWMKDFSDGGPLRTKLKENEIYLVLGYKKFVIEQLNFRKDQTGVEVMDITDFKKKQFQ